MWRRDGPKTFVLLAQCGCRLPRVRECGRRRFDSMRWHADSRRAMRQSDGPTEICISRPCVALSGPRAEGRGPPI